MSWFDKLFGDNGRNATKKGEINKDNFSDDDLKSYDLLFGEVFDFIQKHGEVKVTKFDEFSVKICNDSLFVFFKDEHFVLEKSKLNKVLPFLFRDIVPKNSSNNKSLELIRLIHNEIVDRRNIKIKKFEDVSCLLYSLKNNENKYFYDPDENVIYEINITYFHYSSNQLLITKFSLEKEKDVDLHKIVKSNYLMYDMEYRDIENYEKDLKILNHLANLKSIPSIETVWEKYILEMRILHSIARDKELELHLKFVLNKHKMYNDMAKLYKITPAADITNYKTYLAFIKLNDIDGRFGDFEIENYLRNIGKYLP